jgi:Bifunctional DNA primase/polymerase, N-terminal
MTIEHVFDRALDPAQRYLVLSVEPEKGGITTMCGFRESAPEDFPRTKILVTRDMSKGAHLVYALEDEEDVGSGPIVLGPGVSVTSGKKCLVPRKFKPANDQPIVWVTKGLIDRCKAARMAASARVADGALDTAPIDIEAVTPALETNSPANHEANSSTMETTPMANLSDEPASVASPTKADDGLSIDAPLPEPNGVPFMMTAEIKRKLRDRGFTDDAIHEMTPARAWQILAQPPGAPDANPSTNREAQAQFSTKPAVIKQPYPSKSEAALDHANCGFLVFPLVPNTKVPRQGSHGCYDGTTDKAQICAWWKENPDYNVGIHTKGLAVVDVDPKNHGNKTFEALAKEHNFPPTLISKTRSDGFHWIYRLPPGGSVAGGAHKLGDGVDILSDGRYIVAPGSSIDGRFYTWQNDFPVEMVPEWLPEQCGRAKSRSENAGKRLVEEDETAIQMARDWVERQPGVPDGQIDDTEFKIAARCYDLGCDVDTVEELLHQWCEKHNIPTS